MLVCMDAWKDSCFNSCPLHDAWVSCVVIICMYMAVWIGVLIRMLGFMYIVQIVVLGRLYCDDDLCTTVRSRIEANLNLE